MSYKRSRATFEADIHAPYAIFGTPLPDEAEGRDDGAYLPVWKQDVRDERGRRRLHGAFTGGFSAGYFNTVGSKEGWTPSTFVSSRTARDKKDDAPARQPQQRPEDYMDEEDLEDAAEAQKLQTSRAFAGLGSSTKEELRAGGLMGLFRAEGDTMGLKLLRKMGWKDGQGVGPKVRRGARLDVGNAAAGEAGKTYLFAPENAPMIEFVRKTDRKGLGHRGESKLALLGRGDDGGAEEEDDQPDDRSERPPLLGPTRSKPKAQRGGIGTGILNDTGSDDDDPYEIGPKIRYNRVIGADKKKKAKKAAAAASNPALRNAPVFVRKTARVGNGLRRCHDGRLPLDGFVLASIVEDLTELLLKYAPPPVPPDWVSSKKSASGSKSQYIYAADAAKASVHDPRSRAAMLGEQALPGKSVFDFLSTSARDQLAAASGKSNLPPGRGEIPEGFALSDEERQQALWDQAPKLDRETATAALARGSTGPYADNEAKRARYRQYLEHLAHADTNHAAPVRANGMTEDDFIREINEFYNCARIFKPMTGFMASRFTTAKNTSVPSSDGSASTELLSKPEPKAADPAEEAAKMGMFGTLTRSVEDFYPTRLLCKRFNVRAPAHVRPENDQDENGGGTSRTSDAWPSFPSREATQATAPPTIAPVRGAIEAPPEPVKVEVNPEKNEAVEGKTAHADVLRAIFGDSDSE